MAEHSGQFRVRLPTELHAALAAEAERQGVSLNALVIALLAGGVSFASDAESPRREELVAKLGRSQIPEIALLADEIADEVLG